MCLIIITLYLSVLLDLIISIIITSRDKVMIFKFFSQNLLSVLYQSHLFSNHNIDKLTTEINHHLF